MSHEPKKRHSRQRQGKRRASISLDIDQTVTCKNCGSQRKAHNVCAKCGFYKGKQILKQKTQDKPEVA